MPLYKFVKMWFILPGIFITLFIALGIYLCVCDYFSKKCTSTRSSSVLTRALYFSAVLCCCFSFITYVISINAGSQRFIHSLEYRYRHQEKQLDAILLLGGGGNTRVNVASVLQKRYNVDVIPSGHNSEAATMKKGLVALNVPPDRIVLEPNLYEENNAIDLIVEIVNVMESEIPNLSDSVLLRNNSIDRDIRVLQGKLKWYLAENSVAINDIQLDINNILRRLWLAVKCWFEGEALNLLKDKYLIYDNWNGGTYVFNIDYESEYKLRRGMNLPAFFNNDCPNMEDIKLFLELAYQHWIKEDRSTHYEFTVNVNGYFQIFKLPYRLQNGVLLKQGYKTSFDVDEIIDYKMFERKIRFSEDMIMSKDLLEKKSALDFIVDAFMYLVSIGDGKDKNSKCKFLACTVNSDLNSKVYSVVRNELDEIYKISNEYFDIRHNEYLNGAKQVRESLNDPQFIEYLYNRIYAVLQLFRLKRRV